MNSIRDDKKVIESNAITTCDVSTEQKNYLGATFVNHKIIFPINQN